MALLVQSDYDALQPQLQAHKRTAGANAGKLMREIEVSRGKFTGSPPTANALAVLILYTDGVSETLVFEPSVAAYPPGAADTQAHYPGTPPP